MPMHRRLPVVAAVESGRQLSGRGDIRFAVQGVADLVWILFVDARKREICEPFSNSSVELSGCSGALSAHRVSGKKQNGGGKCGLHRAATLNETSAGLKPLGRHK